MAQSTPKTVYSEVTISTDNAEEVHFTSPNQHRRKIRQIGNSIDEIEKLVLQGNLKVYPRVDKQTYLQTLLCQRLEELSPRGLAYVGESLSVSANIKSQMKPDDILYDVCFIMDDKPAAVLSVTKTELDDKKMAERYNTSLARGVVQAVRKFIQEPFSVVFGLVSETDLTSQESFDKILGNIITKTSRVCVPESLTMAGDKYKIVIRAFLSSVALTDSVVNTDQSDTLWFLTLEQFCILSENMDQQEVIVRTAPSSGGKVLMREVARRLERSGPTLLVMESEEQIQIARHMRTCSFIMTKQEWTDFTRREGHLKEVTNMVTNCQDCPGISGIKGRSWTFISGTTAKADKDSRAEISDTSATMLPGTMASSIPIESSEEHPSEIIRKLQKELKDKDSTIAKMKAKIVTAKQASSIPLESSEEHPSETIRKLQKELKDKDSTIVKMKEEIVTAKQAEEELNRLLDSVSLGGLSLDSGVGSETLSLASWTSRSAEASGLSLDTQGAAGGQSRSKGLLKNVLKKLRGKQFAEKAMKASIPTALCFTDEGAVFYLTDETKRNPIILLCGQHEMDRERVDVEYCHVTVDGRLVNTTTPSRIRQGSRRFKKYHGTCSTSPIHLPPSPSSLTPVSPAPQYWETETAVGVEGGEEGVVDMLWPVMEMGVEEDKMDRDRWVNERPRSWCVKVGWCDIHRDYCTQVWNQGKHVKCVRDTMSNTPGTSYTLRYGVIVDVVRGRVGLVDVDKGVVLEKMDVKFTQTIYPVFAVCPYPNDFTVKMRLINGIDVTMTEDKQKLIHSCLT